MKKKEKRVFKQIISKKSDRYEITPSGEIKYYGRISEGFNIPKNSDKKDKKMMVLAKVQDKIALIHFGSIDYKHNYTKETQALFRERLDCDTAKDKLTARYWECTVMWSGPRDDTELSPKERRKNYQKRK
ncbi:MAG: hypothetical protein K9M15_03120 [Candidatus Marinimicrobia bacterium]|nr:hypothetical protein [Candidatus Neomarinimicrobiota bacterium]